MEKLNNFEQKFILHWGEMGTRWGVNRTVAQIHALLYLAAQPLDAEQIASLLEVARSNVSTSLRELQSWGLARVTHVMGDRRDHFETTKDITALFQIILEERKRREIDPTRNLLHQCLEEAEQLKLTSTSSAVAIRNMAVFLDDLDDLYEHVRGLPSTALVKLLRLGKKLRGLLGV